MSNSAVSVSAPDKYVMKTMLDAMAYAEEPYSYSNEAITDSYAKAVEGLAALEGSKELEAGDFEALGLRINLGKLADLIEADPYFVRSILAGKKSLEKGKKEIISSTVVPSVPPTYYRRLVYMMQIALRHLVAPELPTTGYYGDETAKAVAEFQELVGIEGGQEGNVAGPRTLSAIVMRCRTSKSEMIDALAHLQSSIGEEGAFFYWDPSRENLPDYVKQSRETIIDAMKWLGYANLDLDPHMAQASDLVRERVGFEDGMVTVAVVQKIIDMVTDSDS